jgi:hypothetical protein
MLEEETIVTEKPVEKPVEKIGKVFNEEYVQSLREEAKANRLAKKAVEAKLKTLIGLKDDEDIDDAKITAYQTNQQKTVTEAVSKANARLISAEIKSLEGYDAKLLDRLVDRSKITIDEAGEIKGLSEQLPALEAEFPAIKKAFVPANAANPANSGEKSLRDRYNEAMLEAAKDPRNRELTQKVFLLGEQLRQK